MSDYQTYIELLTLIVGFIGIAYGYVKGGLVRNILTVIKSGAVEGAAYLEIKEHGASDELIMQLGRDTLQFYTDIEALAKEEVISPTTRTTLQIVSYPKK